MPINIDYNTVYQLVLNTKSIILNSDFATYNKSASDFVTDLDLQVNSYLKKELSTLCPEVSFFSEEEESKLSNNCWILDPIDGTTNLVYGYNMSSVSLAHYQDGEIIFGMVYNPFSNEAFSAIKGQGAFLNKTKRLSVSSRPIQESIIEIGIGSNDKKRAESNLKISLELFKKCLDVRRICSSALAICFIADARIDGYFERILKPWDYAAAHCILTEAGGMTMDFERNPLQFAHTSSCIATNSHNISDVFDIIQKFK